MYIDAIYKLDGIKNFVKLAKENVLDIMGRFTIEYNDLKVGYDPMFYLWLQEKSK